MKNDDRSVRTPPSRKPGLRGAGACLHALILAVLAGPALAARPMITDDAGVTERGHCQVDLFGARATARDAAAIEAGWLQGNCGTWDGTALGLGYGYARSDGAVEHAWVVASKTALNAAADTEPAFTLALAGTGLRNGDQALRFDSLCATLIGSMPFDGAWTLHANLAWTHFHPTRQSTTGIALALEHRFAAGVRAAFEAFTNDRDRQPWLSAGVNVPLAAGWSANASWGARIGPARARLATLGLTKDF